MPELRIEDHSEEVQHILGRIPGWVIRWGISVLFITVASIFVGSYFIPYPETMVFPARMVTMNAPAPIVAPGSGRIEQWFKNDQTLVEEGEAIALFSTNDDYEDVLRLKTLLNGSPSLNLTEIAGLNLPSMAVPMVTLINAAEDLKSLRSSNELEVQLSRCFTSMMCT